MILNLPDPSVCADLSASVLRFVVGNLVPFLHFCSFYKLPNNEAFPLPKSWTTEILPETFRWSTNRDLPLVSCVCVRQSETRRKCDGNESLM